MAGPVLVTGGTGFVGSHLVEALLARGRAVRCLVRDPRQPKWLDGMKVEAVTGTLEDADALRKAVAGVEVVYHVAGLTKAPDRDGYMRGNADGAVRLAEAALEAAPGLKKFLLVSSLAASGPAPEGRAVREDDPCRPVSSYGESKVAAEERLKALGDRLPLVIVRPPIVIGPRDAEFFQVFKAVSRHIRPHLGWGKTLSWVYATDLAQGMIAATESPRAGGATWFIAHPRCVRGEELGEEIARALGTWSIPVRIPDAVTAALAFAAETGNRLLGRMGIFNREKAREIAQKSWVCDVSRARADLGFECATPLAEALRRTAAWYRERKWL